MSKAYSGISNLEAMQGAVKYNSHLADLITSSIENDDKNLLDFGAGNGTFAKILRDQDFKIECVEQDQELIEALQREKFVVHDSLVQIDASSRTFVYSLNVLEHIVDDQQVANELIRRLVPGGILVIYVPAFRILWSSMDDAVGHCRRYTKKTLLALFTSEELEIQKLNYVDSLGFFASLVIRFLGASNGKLSPRIVQTYDRFIFPISKFIDRLKLPFGKNILLVAKRRN